MERIGKGAATHREKLSSDWLKTKGQLESAISAQC